MKVATISAVIVDIKNVILPDMDNAEVLKKLFQSEEITDKASLKRKIHEVLTQQKRENALHQAVEKVIDEVKASMSVSIPHTVLREEMTARVKQLGDRLGGEAGMKQYFDKIGEEATQKVYNDIETSARQSLEKFFILRKFVELLEITDIDWNKNLDAEEKIYAKLSTGTTKSKAKTVKNTEDATEEKPAKKATPKAKKSDDNTSEDKPKKPKAKKE